MLSYKYRLRVCDPYYRFWGKKKCVLNTDSPERVESRPLFVSPSTSPRIATINLALIIVRYRCEVYGFTFLILTGIRLLAVNLHLF